MKSDTKIALIFAPILAAGVAGFFWWQKSALDASEAASDSVVIDPVSHRPLIPEKAVDYATARAGCALLTAIIQDRPDTAWDGDEAPAYIDALGTARNIAAHLPEGEPVRQLAETLTSKIARIKTSRQLGLDVPAARAKALARIAELQAIIPPAPALQ